MSRTIVAWVVSRPILACVVAVVVTVGAASALQGIGSRTPREIVLVARGMAFELEGDAVSNPTIRLRAGERVQLTLKNRSPGFVHDLAIDRLGVQLDPVSTGESRSRIFTVPGEPGVHEYVCRPHAQMMRGRVVVAP